MNNNYQRYKDHLTSQLKENLRKYPIGHPADRLPSNEELDIAIRKQKTFLRIVIALIIVEVIVVALIIKSCIQ